MFVFSQYLGKSDHILARRAELRERMPAFYQNHYEVFEGRNTNLSILNEREQLFKELVDDVIG
jgi:hypothetical protein